MDVGLKVLAEEVGDESGNIFEPRESLMSFEVDWRLSTLIEGIEHDEDCHIKSKRRAIAEHGHNLWDNCFVILHDDASDDPVEHWQSLVMSQLCDFPYKELFVFLGEVIDDYVLLPLH